METGSQILDKEMNLIRKDLIDKHLQLGMKASGNWIDSLSVETRGLKSILWGAPYTEQLVNGRPPGKFPPIKAIKQWIEDKNITPFDTISISSLAFLIARKIAKEGTEYFKEGGTDLVSSVITPQRIQRIIDNVTEFHISSFFSEVTGVLESIKASA